MIETLILGFLLGLFSAGVGAACAAYKYLNRPYVMFKTTDGCVATVFDSTFEDCKINMIGIKNGSGDIVAGIKFDKEGVKDVFVDAKV